MERLKLDPKYNLLDIPVLSRIINEEGTIELKYKNNTHEFFVTSGLRKRVYEDGLIILTMPNNDIKVVSIIII
jgi:hypothetical protein